jgi:regulatory protein
MPSAYAEALRLLARRELSEVQVRERLARKAFERPAIDEAVARLRRSGAIDDLRVATAAARTEALVKRRGRLRIRRHLAEIGIAADTIARALEDVFSAIDEAAVIEAALGRRLRGPRARIEDAAHFRKLHQHLVRQGFQPSAVTALLRRRARPDAAPDDEE